jgi:hypothetical protein
MRTDYDAASKSTQAVIPKDDHDERQAWNIGDAREAHRRRDRDRACDW